MSKFTDAANTSHTHSVVAMEEASRVGQRTADIDHLFIALVLSEQAAGQALRSLGITLESARQAVADQHAEQLATLGVHAVVPEPGRIVFHETDGYEWGERAAELIKRANERGKGGDAAAVLRELVVESSGMIEVVLDRLGTTPEAVIARLDEAERHRSRRPREATRSNALSGVSEVFVPASVEQVWELLATPSRMPEWEPSIGSVERTPTAARVGDTWVALARSERPDGKQIPVKSGFARQQVELRALDMPRLVEWRVTYPEAQLANARCLRVELEPVAGGTQLRLSFAWERDPSRPSRAFLGLVLRPVHRFVLWMQLSQLGSSISRVFR